jgi:hypothetical protein
LSDNRITSAFGDDKVSSRQLQTLGIHGCPTAAREILIPQHLSLLHDLDVPSVAGIVAALEAKTLGLTIPASFLSLADELID